MHKKPKKQHSKYLVRRVWEPDEWRYQNTTFMHGWHPRDTQGHKTLEMEPGRFLTEACLNGQKWWECTKNTCLWHIGEKKRTQYWLKKRSGNNKPHIVKGI